MRCELRLVNRAHPGFEEREKGLRKAIWKNSHANGV